MSLPEHCICGYQAKIDRLTAEVEQLTAAYRDLFQIANHAYCFNNFKVLQDNMKENQKTASELGLYP